MKIKNSVVTKFRTNSYEKKLIMLRAKKAGLSQSEFCKKAVLEMKITERLTEEQIEFYKMLITYHNNFKSIANLIKAKHPGLYQKINLTADEIKNHLQNFKKMIGKGKAISHTGESMQYGWNQEKDAKVVFKQNLVGDCPKEITQEFKTIQSMNNKCDRNTFSFVISPTIEDGKNLSQKDLKNITDEFIKDLKLENHQAIAFVHNDKSHKHIHLYVNRIDFEGKAYKDSFIGKRSQKSAERVAEKLQLQTVKQVKQQQLDNVKDIRKLIKNKHELSFSSFHPTKYQNYINKMEELGVKVKPVINKSEKLQGFRYQFKGVNLKGSDVHRSMSINTLNTNFYKISKAIIKQTFKTITR